MAAPAAAFQCLAFAGAGVGWIAVEPRVKASTGSATCGIVLTASSGLDWHHEAVSPALDGFDVARLVGRVCEGDAQLFDRGVDGIFKLDDRVIGPEAAANVFARDKLARGGDQQAQDLERLLLKRDLLAEVAKFGGAGIQLEGTKTEGRSPKLAHHEARSGSA